MTWLFMAIGAALVVGAALAYAGLWRSWSTHLHPTLVFAWLFGGFAIFGFAFFGAVVDTSAGLVGVVVALLAFVATLVFVALFLFGTPRWFIPRWYRSEGGR